MENSPNISPVLPRIRDFEKMAFGLFIHFGLSSLMEAGEWVQFRHNIPTEKYAELVTNFTASEYNPAQIVQTARAAGMRYICVITRHHDGFSLYDTRGLSDFDAPHSPAGRDLIQALAEVCHAVGMPLFFYHTTLDWKVASFDQDWEAYLSYLRASVEVLCRHYGKVAGFWFDGNWSRPDRDWQEEKLYALIRRYQPDCIIVNNSGLKARGERGNSEIDVLTFEQGTPSRINRAGADKYLAAEMCETMNSHWGTAKYDLSYKSPGDLINRLLDCRRYGANLLLNVGLLGSGKLPEYEAATLGLIGRWLALYGLSLYETTPTDFLCKGTDFVLQNGNDYFYFDRSLPIAGNEHLYTGEKDGGLRTIAGQLPPVKSVCWLDNGAELRFWQNPAQGVLTFQSTGYPYGMQMIGRVAKLTT
jgi:alpha-L-fucosidase